MLARILFTTWFPYAPILAGAHNDVLDLQISRQLCPYVQQYSNCLCTPLSIVQTILELLVYSNSPHLQIPKCGSQTPKWSQWFWPSGIHVLVKSPPMLNKAVLWLSVGYCGNYSVWLPKLGHKRHCDFYFVLSWIACFHAMKTLKSPMERSMWQATEASHHKLPRRMSKLPWK